MEEKRGTSGGVLLAQETGDLHQMVVVDPEQRIFAGLGGHDGRELAIDREIASPVGRVKIAARLQVVEQRPDDLVGEAQIEARALFRGKKHGFETVAGFFRGRAQLLGDGGFLLRAWPSDPQAGLRRKHGRQGGHQSAGGGTPAPLRAFARQHQRQTVGDHDQAAGHGAPPRQ